jgi:hypothetical protein
MVLSHTASVPLTLMVLPCWCSPHTSSSRPAGCPHTVMFVCIAGVSTAWCSSHCGALTLLVLYTDDALSTAGALLHYCYARLHCWCSHTEAAGVLLALALMVLPTLLCFSCTDGSHTVGALLHRWCSCTVGAVLHRWCLPHPLVVFATGTTQCWYLRPLVPAHSWCCPLTPAVLSFC